MSGKLFFVMIAFLEALSLPVYGYETHGRVTVNNFFSRESSDAPDYNISTIRLRLNAEKNTDRKTRFVLDTRYRIKAGREYHSDIPDYRINSLYFQLKEVTGRVDVDAGRFFVADARGVRVDGAHMRYRLSEGKTAGVFGGGEPDPYHDEFNTAYGTFGGYFKHEKKRAGFGVASVTSYYKGRQDRSLVDMRGFFKPVKRTRVSHSVTLDYDKINRSINLTNLTLNLSSGFFSSLRIRLGYNRYKPVRRFESMNFDLTPGHEERYTLNVSYRGLKNYLIYSGAGYRYRTFDHRGASRFSMGVRIREVFASGAVAELRFSWRENYTAKQQSVFAEFGREFFGKLDLSLNATVQRESFTFLDLNQTTSHFQLSSDLRVSRSIFLSANMEYLNEEQYDTTTLFTQITYKF